MVRWRFCLVLAVLLLVPKTGGKLDEDDDEEPSPSVADGSSKVFSVQLPMLEKKYSKDGNEIRTDDAEEEEDDDDDDDEDEQVEKAEAVGRRAPALVPTPKPVAVTRTIKKLPLECYVCAFKNESPLRSCLDPTKYRVHSVTCRSVDEKCFTQVVSKGKSYEAVLRGCRTGCIGSTDTTCCELNRCNNQAFAMPLVPRALTEASKTTKNYPSTVLFFVTILLLLQTVVKVAFV